MKKSKTKKKKPIDHPIEDESDVRSALNDERSHDSHAGEPQAKTEAPVGTETPVDDPATLRDRIEKLEDALLRARAEYQNFQRRTAIERAEAIRYANAGLMKSLLSVVDDFERAISMHTGERDAIDEGVRLVYENLLKALREHGLEIIETDNESFDPSVHEAMMQQPSADHSAGMILKEFAKGYKLRGRVLRPSKVVVSKAAEIPQSDSTVKDEPDAAEHVRK